MTELTVEYLEFKKQIEKQQKVVARKQKLADKQIDILREMLANCTHEEIEHKESYFSGSYYDKATTTHWNQCKLCGERSPETVEMHSWYG